MIRSKPIIYLGQSGEHLHQAITELNSQVCFPTPSSLCINHTFSPSVRGCHLHLKPCPIHPILPGNSSSTSSEHNSCVICRENQESVDVEVHRLMETMDYVSGQQVTVLGGITEAGSDSKTYHHLLNLLLEDYPQLELHLSVVEGGARPRGVDAYSTLLALDRLWQHYPNTSSLLLRNFEDFLYEDDVERARKTSGPSQTVSLQDYYHWLACDLWPIVTPSSSTSLLASYGREEEEEENNPLLLSRSLLWPYHIRSHPVLLIDVRTSLYRTLQKTTTASRSGKSKGEVEIQPSRLLATSLHRLHQSYQERFPHYFPLLERSSRMISVMSISLDSRAQRWREVIGKDLNVQWATKGLKWLLYEDWVEPTVLESKLPKAGKGQMVVSTVSFQSPYIHAELLNLLDGVQGLLSVQAHRHLLGDDQWEDIIEATLRLEDLLGSLG
eukprot:gene4211-4622_t